MIVTAMRIPVPLPIAPERSAATESTPRMAPPGGGGRDYTFKFFVHGSLMMTSHDLTVTR
jgi:hypothetical protein